MTPRDYYEILGVPKSATEKQIKTAFRQLAQKYHPDVSDEADAEERFKEINTAYQVLNDPDKRARYDRFGHAGVNGDAGFGGAGFGNMGGMGGFEDIFEMFTGFSDMGGRRGGSQRQGPRRGRDLSYEVVIDFEEAVFGLEKDIELERYAVCSDCTGSGAAPGTTPSRCPDCSGTGEVRTVRQTFLGSMINVTTCPRCQGRGEVVTTPCQTCNGSGKERVTRQLEINIPAGVDNGMKIRIPGEGEPGEFGGPAGNLYVVINVRDHEYFTRRNDDILLEISINVAQATLGDTIIIPTVDDETHLEIPAGTQSGESFKIKGEGFPQLRRDGTSARRGDQWVIVQVVVPKQLNERQRELFAELAESLDTDIMPPQNRGFFDRVLDFLSGEPQ